MTDSDQPPPALTDLDIAKLEAAIRAEGYEILLDPATGDVKLVKVGPGAEWRADAVEALRRWQSKMQGTAFDDV
jgi:hypothetical protein